jgi:hypothetical protein
VSSGYNGAMRAGRQQVLGIIVIALLILALLIVRMFHAAGGRIH